MNTFYLPAEDWGAHCTLPPQEARHLAQVLRMRAGEQVRRALQDQFALVFVAG